LYDACNTFPDFLEKIDIDFTSQKAARYTVTEDLDITYPDAIQESITINETAQKRIIWLTIETRPEYVTHENCQLWRDLWVTRMEMGIQTLHNDVHEANVRGHDNQAIREAMHKLRQYGFKVSNHYMPWLYTSTPEKDLETFEIAFGTPWIKSDELKFYPTAVIPNTPLYDLYKSGEYTPIQEDDLAHIIKEFKTNIIPPYSRIKRLARDFDTNEVVAGANTPNLRQLLMNEMQKQFNIDPQARKKQYTRLYGDDESYTHVDDQDGLLSAIKTPMGDMFDTHISLSSEERKIDRRMETYTLGGCFDIDRQRNFSCLCTRCREMRHIADNGNQQIEDTKTQADRVANQAANTDIPFLVVRRYRSSNGEEMFLSIEDSLWYLYGFVRLLLPDVWVAVDYEWVQEGKALVREVHVYGSLASLDLDGSKSPLFYQEGSSAQHKWFGTQLMEAAEAISKTRWYEAVSVISWVWVRGYYEKLWYGLVGTYMVKEV
jgi:histone acetyltransferase (RNA polymerase elongator complex component)